MKEIKSVAALAARFSALPGVGRKTALRYAYAVIDMSEAEVDAFCTALKEVKSSVRLCSVCGNFTDGDVCELCATRSNKHICVVAYPKDVIAVEKSGAYSGAYHVLHGVIDPMNGVSPNDIRIKELLARVNEGNVKEIIMATNPDVEGEATAMYLAKLLKPLGITVTRLAHGIPIGSELEYTDEVTLARALIERKQM